MKKIVSALLISMFCFAASAFADQTYNIDLSKPQIVITENSSEKLELNFGCHVYHNTAYGNSWIMHNPGCSFIELQFHKEEGANGPAELTLTHLASVVCDSFYSPITISVNDQVVVTGFSPSSSNYITDTFDLTGLFQDGMNSVRISLDSDAYCNYWIQSIKLNIEHIYQIQ